MDSPKVYSGQTGAGLYYVQTDNAFPMRGNGFYYEPTIEYCLENKLIASTDIKYVINSSLTIEANHFNKFIDSIYDNLDDDLKKNAINGMIGCFKPKARENWKSLCITKSANEAYNSFLALNA